MNSFSSIGLIPDGFLSICGKTLLMTMYKVMAIITGLRVSVSNIINVNNSINTKVDLLIANIFLAYIIGYEALFDIIIDDPRKHIGGLVAILIFSTIFYLVFSKMREQVL